MGQRKQPKLAKLLVLASGGGRTLENLQQCILKRQLQAEIVGVVVSQTDLGVVNRAERLGLPWQAIGRKTHPDPELRTAALVQAMQASQADWVVLAGWLQLLPIPAEWEGKVLNIHPALLPAYGGKGYYGHHVHDAVKRDRQSVSGCTVHFASDAYDQGPILLQEAVLLDSEMSAEQIADRVFEAEKRVYPAALQALITGQAHWQDGQVYWS
jgi:phosphoribosylglycinamide formyltransferase 1